MSDIGFAKTREGSFSDVTVVVLLAVGISAFVGMLLLGAYAPDMRSGRNGGAHALSNAAIGFGGIVRLAEATGRNPQIVRNPHLFGSEDLLVVTPEHGATNISEVLQARRIKPTLYVFPKWSVEADPDHSGWVRRAGIIPRFEPEGVFAPGRTLKIVRRASGGMPLVNDPILPSTIRFVAPRPLQTMTGRGLRPLITDGHGGIVVGQFTPHLYVLADPDLLSNMGMRDAGQARSALELLDWMNSTGATSIGFDVTLNGFGHSLSPLKLLFDPPFLAMTIGIAVALLLAGVQAVVRFGPEARRPRAIAFGKAALVDNAAALIRKANREARLGGRFANVIREQAVAAFAVPARLKGDAIDAYLDKLGGNRRFGDLAAAAEAAGDKHDLVAAAQALQAWKQEKTL